MASLYLSKNYTKEEAFTILKSQLRNQKVINMVENMNSFDIITEWGKFTYSIHQNSVSVKQGWNKEKSAIMIILAILTLIIWLPGIAILILACVEYSNMKQINQEITNILNNYES